MIIYHILTQGFEWLKQLNKKQKEILENSLGQTIVSKTDEQTRFEFDNLL